MTVEKMPVDKAVLKELVPCDALSVENLSALATKTFVETMRAGETLFKAGQRDRKRFYVLQGDVVLEAPGQAPRLVRGGTKEAKQALDPHQPHSCVAMAKTAIKFVALDEELLGTFITWDQSTGLVVNEMEDNAASADEDWMTRILQTKSFLRVPAANIQAMFMRLQPVSFQAGELVVKQGDPGDFYYIVSRGRCAVIRTVPETGKEIKLTELKCGDSFGEESLLGDAPRNASVKMLTDGSLMRLSRADFEKLLKQPVLKTVTFDQAVEMSMQGTVLLDVRLENEYPNDAMQNSINMPLYLLRLKVSTLDPKKKYVVYCDSGKRSASAAYLLNERGFDVYLLAGGLAGVPA